MMMRTPWSVLAAGSLLALGLGGAPTAGAGPLPTGTATVPVGSWSATVVVADAQWASVDCQDVPITVTIAGAGIDIWSVDANARLSGSGTSAGAFAWGEVAGTFTEEGFFLCPDSDPSGVYDVTGVVEISDFDLPGTDTFTASFATSFTLSPMPTTGDGRPSPTVKVKAVKQKSKLRVDVNPNKGRGYWKFKVQKQRASGSWKSLKTYRTKGKKETRVINLKKGTYRVVVKPKYGYGATTSGSVYLKR